MWNLKDFYTEADFDTTDAHLAEAAAQNLLPRERALVDKLRLANAHSRQIFLAVARPSDDNSLALLKFRREHGLEEFPHNEQYWGDVTGVRRVEQFKDFTPPYLRTRCSGRSDWTPKTKAAQQWFKPRRLTSASGTRCPPTATGKPVPTLHLSVSRNPRSDG